jgi:hypothetical protein
VRTVRGASGSAIVGQPGANARSAGECRNGPLESRRMRIPMALTMPHSSLPAAARIRPAFRFGLESRALEFSSRGMLFAAPLKHHRAAVSQRSWSRSPFGLGFQSKLHGCRTPRRSLSAFAEPLSFPRDNAAPGPCEWKGQKSATLKARGHRCNGPDTASFTRPQGPQASPTTSQKPVRGDCL